MTFTQQIAVDGVTTIFYTGGKSLNCGGRNHEPSSTELQYAAIRRLLLAAFNYEEFAFFCYDNFREVYQKFAAGMTFTAKAQILIEHCELRNEFGKLLPSLEAANPARYTEFASSPQKSELKIQTTNSQSTTPRGHCEGCDWP